MGDIEAGGTLFGMGIKRILRIWTGDCAGGISVCGHATRIVDGLRPRIAYLHAWAALKKGARERRLQRVIGRVRRTGDQLLSPEPSNCVPGAIELGIRREARGRRSASGQQGFGLHCATASRRAQHDADFATSASRHLQH